VESAVADALVGVTMRERAATKHVLERLALHLNPLSAAPSSTSRRLRRTKRGVEP
jgi:hypothetical protein